MKNKIYIDVQGNIRLLPEGVSIMWQANLDEIINKLELREFEKYNTFYVINNIYINDEKELVIVGCNEQDDSDENVVFIKLEHLPDEYDSEYIFNIFKEEF